MPEEKSSLDLPRFKTRVALIDWIEDMQKIGAERGIWTVDMRGLAHSLTVCESPDPDDATRRSYVSFSDNERLQIIELLKTYKEQFIQILKHKRWREFDRHPSIKSSDDEEYKNIDEQYRREFDKVNAFDTFVDNLHLLKSKCK